MRLPAGSRLGRYEIVAHLGSGGMGDVYRARDTHLDKAVALKTIAASYAHDPTSQPRFERERRLTASLDHPHICRLLDAGHKGDIQYLAMEYLDGESLAERLARGPLPVAAAIGYAIEIADALQYAHRLGVVHRDLKPANVFLTQTGAKVLDFGLAKLLRNDAGGPAPVMTGDTVALDVTAAGAIVGSAPYMAPERIEGQDADHRTDVFGFGVLLYEMLTAQRAFGGPRPLVAILSEEPPPLRVDDPKAADLEWVIRKCLAKKPDDRWQSMADVQTVLRRLAGTGLTAESLPRPRKRGTLAALILVPLVLAAAIGWIALQHEPVRRSGAAPLALTITPPPGGAFTPAPGSVQSAQLALAPDGSAVAFVAAGPDGISRVWVRKFASVLPAPIAGTEGATFPFWSPDSRSLGFFSRDALRRVDLAGGPSQSIASAEHGRGGTWNASDDILFSPNTTGTILRVRAKGGPVAEATRLDASRGETSHRWPQFLPDGRRFLYFARSTVNPDQHDGIYLGSLDGDPVKLMANSSVGGTFLPPNNILLLEDGALLARTINLADGAITGPPVVVAERVGSSSNFYGAFSASNDGAIAYASSALTSDLVWLDRGGRRTSVVALARQHVDFRLSPDGRTAAVAELDRETDLADIYVLDLIRPERLRITSTRANDASPVWSPDGRTLVFRSNRERVHDLYLTDSTGVGPDRPFQRSVAGKYPTSWSPDGQRIAFHTRQNETGWDVLAADLRAGSQPRPLLGTRFDEIQAQFSPVGNLIAYTSNVSGSFEVWVQALSEPALRRQVSLKGGSDPRWRADGAELFYISASGHLMAVAVQRRGDGIELGNPQQLFSIGDVGLTPPFTSVYDVSLDGQRFLVRQLREDLRSIPLTVLLNWPLQSTR